VVAGEHALHCHVTGASSELISLAQEAPVIAPLFINCGSVKGFDFSIFIPLKTFGLLFDIYFAFLFIWHSNMLNWALPPPVTGQNCSPFINHIPEKKHNHIGGNSGHFPGSLGSAEEKM